MTRVLQFSIPVSPQHARLLLRQRHDARACPDREDVVRPLRNKLDLDVLLPRFPTQSGSFDTTPTGTSPSSKTTTCLFKTTSLPCPADWDVKSLHDISKMHVVSRCFATLTLCMTRFTRTTTRMTTMVATRTMSPTTTMKKTTNQTASASCAVIWTEFGLCEKVHAKHTDSVAAMQCATEVHQTLNPSVKTKPSTHDNHFVPSSSQPTVLLVASRASCQRKRSPPGTMCTRAHCRHRPQPDNVSLAGTCPRPS